MSYIKINVYFKMGCLNELREEHKTFKTIEELNDYLKFFESDVINIVDLDVSMFKV
jgi:hypothetical protein